MKTLPIAGLSFDEIKQNFITYLQQDNFYRDYNFEGSALNNLINILAYNAHHIGYYVKMMLNESFVDSAVRYESLFSKAKLTGYIPRGMRSSRTNIIVTTTIPADQDNISKSLILPRGCVCNGANALLDQRMYYLLDDVICYDRVENPNSTVTYTSPEIVVYEGNMRTWNFVRDTSVVNQRFIIRDKTVDIDTIRVNVYPTQNSQTKDEYLLVTNLFEVQPDSKVFYVSTNEEGLYEIFFGNNQFGKDLENGNRVEVIYIGTSGTEGDGCKVMTFQYVNNDYSGRSYAVEVLNPTSGGLSPESNDELRFNIPNHYRRQQRLVTVSDYKSLLLSEFRNIDSINVWGGEENFTRKYNTVFVSIKPKNGMTLGSVAKAEIEELVSRYQVVGRRIQIVDPTYVYVDIDFHVTHDTTKSSRSKGELESSIIQITQTYNDTVLDRFDNGLSDVDLLDYIRDQLPEIYRIYSRKILSKDFAFQYRTTIQQLVLFGNSLVPDTVESSQFMYAQKTCKIVDDLSGKLWIVDSNGTKLTDTHIGTVNFSNGSLQFVLDEDIQATTDYGTHGVLTFSGQAAIPDVSTYLNNIVTIRSIRTYISTKAR